MNFLLIILITSLLLIVIRKLRFKAKKNSQRNSKLKNEFINWMALTNEQRIEMDFKDKRETLKRKRILLKSIREEYKKLKKK